MKMKWFGVAIDLIVFGFALAAQFSGDDQKAILLYSIIAAAGAIRNRGEE